MELTELLWVRVPLSQFSSISEEIHMKEGFTIIIISQKEAFYLHEHGVPFGENGIKATSSRHSGKTYRLCTSSRNMKMLKNFRNINDKK